MVHELRCIARPKFRSSGEMTTLTWQDKVSPTRELLPLSIWRTARAIDEVCRHEGVSAAAVSVLITLRESARRPMPLHELASAEGVAATSVFRTVTGLATAGLVRRVRDASDRRLHLVELTESGEALSRNALRIMSKGLQGRDDIGLLTEAAAS